MISLNIVLGEGLYDETKGTYKRRGKRWGRNKRKGRLRQQEVKVPKSILKYTLSKGLKTEMETCDKT